MKSLYNITTILAFVLTILVFWVGSIGIHIYTIAEVYNSYGFFWGILAFFCPVIAQITLFVLKIIAGAMSSPYCIILLLYIGAIALTFLFHMLSSLLEIKIREKYADNLMKFFKNDNKK